MSPRFAIAESDVLVAIDVQNDFCPGGRLPVPGGDEIAPLISRLARAFTHVVLTQDWHPPGHASFASAHPGRKPYETIDLPYGRQRLWPDHCVQATPGAELHPALEAPNAELILRKGHHLQIDSYSAFFENDKKTPTGLAGYLRERGFAQLFLAGLAFDFCVLWTADDARRLGFSVAVVEDACRSLDLEGSEASARASLAAIGAERIAMSDLL